MTVTNMILTRVTRTEPHAVHLQTLFNEVVVQELSRSLFVSASDREPNRQRLVSGKYLRSFTSQSAFCYLHIP